MHESHMIVSGILVQSTRDQLPAVRRAVDGLPWADAYNADPNGRLIVTIEADDSETALERLKELKRLPGVLAAEMVIHCFEDEAADASPDSGQSAADLLNRDDEDLPRRSYYSRLKAVGNY